jgi:hypothetical protein
VTYPAGLAPNQKRIYAELLALGEGAVPRPAHRDDLAAELRETLEKDLTPLSGMLGADDDVLVNKFALHQVHACEGLFRASAAEPFDWSVAKLRGRVAHKAIEASILSPRALPPLDLVDHAIERIAADGDGASQFVRSLSPLDLAQLKGEANDAVVKFLTDWPPVERAWIPRVESGVRVPLCAGRVVLRAKYDLAFGRPAGTEARVIIVDFKTGGEYARYSDDLRFYALVETLRSGVPPFRVASYYLDTGDFFVETVTEELLALAARRTVDGVRAMLETREGGRAPRLTPGGWCRFCPAQSGCEAGLQYLAAARAYGSEEAEE